jgi:asparagine synthase (glutamine-hydrolysing)
MCGIVGICGTEPIRGEKLLLSMMAALGHRGPDDAGSWKSPDSAIMLGHRRLSIIDLSSSGHQPMSDSTGRYVIVFNGEIYNFRELRDDLASSGHCFRTQSDTEVLLEAYRRWGERCVERFNGMFAFALYDAARDTLFAARDRAGEKPFFYWHCGNSLFFASELKALMECPNLPRRLDLEAMNFYLTYGYVPWDMCILQGVRKLPQGHVLRFERRMNRLSTWRYWSLPEPQHVERVDTRELVHEYKDLLTDAIRRQLVADVPVGILLSGGVDSSLITALASQVSAKPVKTFTISFPGYTGYNEEPYAQMVANHFGTEHNVLPAASVSIEMLPKLARQYDEPLADSSMIPTFLVFHLIRQHATVAIGGDGGDELFGGYAHYTWLLRQAMVRRCVPAWVRSRLSLCADRCLPVGFRGRNYLLGAEGGVQNSFAFVNQFFDRRTRGDLFPPLLSFSPEMLARPERFKAEMELPGKTVVQRSTAADFISYLTDDILVKVDRASMLTSIEARAPFLDYRIIEFAFSKVPDSLRVRGNTRKILSRLLAQDLLPKALDLTRKQGFAIPLAKWVEGEWGVYMRSILLDSDSWFDRRVVRRLFEGQENGRGNAQRLFALTMAELWRREYRVELPSQSANSVNKYQ